MLETNHTDYPNVTFKKQDKEKPSQCHESFLLVATQVFVTQAQYRFFTIKFETNSVN